MFQTTNQKSFPLESMGKGFPAAFATWEDGGGDHALDELITDGWQTMVFQPLGRMREITCYCCWVVFEATLR